jgi:hypothetical protein
MHLTIILLLLVPLLLVPLLLVPLLLVPLLLVPLLLVPLLLLYESRDAAQIIATRKNNHTIPFHCHERSSGYTDAS